MAKARLYFDGDNTYIEKQARIYKMVDEIGEKIDNIPGVVNNLSSTSETDALSAAMGKELQDQINAMSGNFHFLSSWDCTTGLPGSDPATDPYVYQSGDYYIVSSVAGSGGTNYKPHGSSYTHGVASTAVETQAVQMNDWYVYDGSTWILQPSGGAQIVVDTALSTTSTNPVENRVITQALNNKQNTISNLSAIESGAAAGATALQPGDNITQLTNNAGYQTAGDVAAAIVGKQDVLTAGEGIAINNNVITNTGITCLTGGDDIEVTQAGTHSLPTGYTELEHISLSGSQYIPTGLSYTSGHTYSIHQRLLFSYSDNNNKGSGWNAGGAIYVSGTTMGDGSLSSNLGPTGGVTDVSIEIGSGTSNYTTVTGGVTRTTSRANTALSDYAGITYPLGVMSGTGGTLQSGSNMIGSIYFFEYTDGNNRGEYYPAQRDSDDALGMYDVVSGTFYPVSGTGAVAGPEASDCTTVNFTNASGYMLKSSNKLIYATTDTAFNTRDKICTTADGNYTPTQGDVLALVFNHGCGVGSPRLDIDGSGLHSISISTVGANASTFWLGMDKITWLFIYDGSRWITWPVKDTMYSAGTGLSLSNLTFTNTQPGPTIGTTAPSSPSEGAMWYDTTNHVLKVYNGTEWTEVGSGGGSGGTNIVEVTVSTAYNTVAKVGTTTSGNYTPTTGDLLLVNFTVGCACDNPTLNIDGSGAKEIRIGQTTAKLTTFNFGSTSTNQKALLYYDGTYYRAYSTTNTTYSEMTNTQADTGTSADAKIISPAVLKHAIKTWATSSGSTAPSSPNEGDLRYDTTNDVLKVYNGSQWAEVGSGGGGGTYTAGTGIAISNNQISSTVFDLSNLTYVGFDSDTLTPSGTSDISCPAGATVAFFSWRIVYSSAVYGAGEIIVPLQASLLKTSFIGGGYAAQTYVKGAIGYDSTGNTIHYTDGGSQGGMSIEYTVYFYK